MPPAKTISLDTHALATLHYIRASINGAGRVPIPGSAGFVVGAIGFAATAISLLPNLRAQWFFIWVAAAPIAAALGTLLLARKGTFASFVAAGAPERQLALGILPSLFAGLVMTAVLWSAGQAGAIPGTWLLLYGCGLISASVSTSVIVAWVGMAFAVIGIVAFAAPASYQIALLGAGFGGLHLIFGFLLERGIHGSES